MRCKLAGIMSIALAAMSLGSPTTALAQEHRGGERAVDCTSTGFARQRCDVSWSDARLERQLSDTRCVRDENWGIDRHGLWVDGGCSGRFVATGGERERERERNREGSRDDDRRGGGWQPDSSWNHRFSVTCESEDGRYHFCQVDLGGGGHAALERQISNTRCVEGQSWGSNRAGVWVSQGCRGVFSVDRRWH